MSADLETHVVATPIVILPVSPDVAKSARTAVQTPPAVPEREREARAEARRRDAQRWADIQEAGGADAWIDADLRAGGFLVDVDPATLTDAEKGAFKERKKVEATERRARKRLVWKAYQAAHVTHVGAGIFFRDDEDEDVRSKDARLVRARENDLEGLASVSRLAEGLGLSPSTIRSLAFHRDVETRSNYYRWTIPKRDGGLRVITSPKRTLKAAQRWLLRYVWNKLPVHSAAHGFLAHRSIATNAAPHAGADLVVKVDIQDFFPTITFRRVKGLLRKAGLPENVATLVALLSTESPREVVSFRGKTLFVAKGPRSLPQGAPTSPAVTNALCLGLDKRVSGLARMLGCRYTRYADDLTFSFHRGDAPKGRIPVGTLLRGVKDILTSESFRIHPKKTRVMRRGDAQRVTGLVVNRVDSKADKPDVPRIPRHTLRLLRAAVWNREHGKHKEGESLESVRGLAAFVHMVDPAKGRALLDRLDKL